ncbi:hypothetical protein MUO32_06285 [Shinella sp. CPCC 101442]|uniref:hypothetical protein n=1 Tax=Shinella sp. CPCC 101442 TaxID=2932265 RepID=UPI00215266EF|nr:hypothetical protein [Shinella sp. CPCC 101442]MCR6498629.1 hypothetical protein [Shinella sp. CPCC 101442]
MTERTGKEARMWERGLAPVSFLVLLFTLFLSQLSLPEGARTAGHPQRAATEGGVAPAPLSTAGDELRFPASGHAERRIAKAKTGLPEGDGAGKAIVPGAGILLYPFEIASTAATASVDDAAPANARPAAFRSRAPPGLAA